MQILSNDALRAVAPSVFAEQPWAEVSDRYAFIPTIQVVEALGREGFFPVRASQSSSRIAGKREFTKHALRFRREQDLNDNPKVVNGNAHFFYEKHGLKAPEIAELVLVNSHDRSSGYELTAGLFRQVCSNGLMVCSGDLGSVKVRHSGDIVGNVIEGTYSIIEQMPKVLEMVDEFKGINLDVRQQEVFAKAALELRYPSDDQGNSTAPIAATELLRIRRFEDKGGDLWSTFNRVQENFIRGGLRGRTETGKRMSTRAIKSVGEDIRINKALWLLTERMAKLAS